MEKRIIEVTPVKIPGSPSILRAQTAAEISAAQPKRRPKINIQDLIEAIRQQDVPFEQGLAQDYIAARYGDDRHLVQKYQQMLLNKIVADKIDIDVVDEAALLETKKNIFTAALAHIAKQDARNDAESKKLNK